MKPYRKRLQFQITVYFILLVIFIINSVGWFLYFRANSYFDEELGKKLISIASHTTNSIEADLVLYLQPGDEEGSFYHSIQQKLSLLKREFDATRIYIVDTTFSVLVDTQPGSFVGSAVPYLQSHLVELHNTLKGTAQFTTLYRGTDGYLYKSAFAPIRTKEGKITAVAGIDASPTFLQVMDRMRNSILFINTLSLVVAIALSFLLAKSIVNPVNKLVNAARRVSIGDFGQPVLIRTNNEIGYLGDIFNAMQENIRINQEKLKELRQLAEAKADTLQSYNEYILQSIGNGILTINLHGNIAVLNPEAARILRINRQKAINTEWEKLIDKVHPFHSIVSGMPAKESQSRIVERQLKFPDSSMTVGVQISPLLDAEGQKIGTNFVMTDLTELRKLQEQIKEKEQLAYLGELSAAVAHEIRNPLNSIELFVGLLKRHTLSGSKQFQNIQKIQTEIQALNAIVTNFLRFARPPQLEIQSFKMTELFQEILLLAESAVQKKNISVRMNVREEAALLKGDFNQLKQACLNVVLNAIQALDNDGKLTLSASFDQEKDDRNWIVIEISDTGEGISGSDLERIFEPFYSTRTLGTGLGLPIVRNIIHSHHGTIFVESETGQGTTVTIRLPAEIHA